MQKHTPSNFSKGLTFAALSCLVVSLFVGIGPNWSSRLIELGGQLWEDYAQDLRVDPIAPDCVLADLDKQLADCPSSQKPQAPSADIGDPFADEADPFADEADPFADEADPFADEADPFADEAPAAKNCGALANMRATCQQRHDSFDRVSARITPAVLWFRLLERPVASLGSFPYGRHLLLLFLGLSALTTTLSRVHIAIRNPKNQREFIVSEGAMLLGHVLLSASSVAHIVIQTRSNMEIEHPWLPFIMTAGFVGMGVVNLWNLWQVKCDGDSPPSLLRLVLVVPLYAYMVVLTGLYFLIVEVHPSGQAIYVEKFAQHPNIYLGIGLYIWSGMLLANTRIAKMLFNVVLPWNLPPTMLAWIVVVAAAYPTAYSGASGIFVIAAGAVIFNQMREAGASPRLALTTTAMSGSLGVVLNPCLIIVLIAMLNKQVTTSELFGWGRWVFVLTAGLFLLAMLARWAADGFQRSGVTHKKSTKTRLSQTGQALLALLPYVGVAAGVLAVIWLLTDTLPNERTAPFVLPVVLLALVGYDRVSDRDRATSANSFLSRLIDATAETTHHSGALLAVMLASVGIGGLIERSGIMDSVPASLGSPAATMAVMVVIMVIVGMTMDALGAVVLVSVSVAGLAYQNGINPIHFWMMVLVAFELGYLSPPVAINHLLARQVIGEQAWVECDDTQGFWAQYEHIVLPMAVMGSALLLVAFVPFAWYP